MFLRAIRDISVQCIGGLPRDNCRAENPGFVRAAEGVRAILLQTEGADVSATPRQICPPGGGIVVDDSNMGAGFRSRRTRPQFRRGPRR